MDVLEVDDAISKFATKYPVHAELVKLRFFSGLSSADAGKVLGLSSATSIRYWKFARAWLARELG